MNIGKDNKHPQYRCDKCGKEIPYIHHKGFEVNKYYRANKYGSSPKKDFDLCKICEKKLKEWLKTKELPTQKDMISKFQIYKEV